jgi:hypothetical protein
MDPPSLNEAQPLLSSSHSYSPSHRSNHSTSEQDDELAFESGDPGNPRNWTTWKKWRIVAAITLVDLSVSWGASGYSPTEKEMERIFGVSATVGTLGLSLYILGLALGPMTLAPLSEVRISSDGGGREEEMAKRLTISSTSDEVRFISSHISSS